ncbi:MAG: ribosome maturation factor RimP [Clostridia bacterium]|nr:ribosome maturation factor RimP [Clostridia bacterium]
MGKIEESVRPIAINACTELGYELYDVEYKKEGPDWYLRVFIDKKEGIGVDDCEKYSRFISPILDEKDPIAENYILEVSSPGMFRKLNTKEHFERYMGQEVEIKLKRSIEGKKKFGGKLASYIDGKVIINTPNGEVSVEKEDYMYVKLNPECF